MPQSKPPIALQIPQYTGPCHSIKSSEVNNFTIRVNINAIRAKPKVDLRIPMKTKLVPHLLKFLSIAINNCRADIFKDSYICPSFLICLMY